MNSAADLVRMVRLRGAFPSSPRTLSEADILFLASEELRSTIFPMVVAQRSDFYLKYERLPVGRDRYIDLPSRSYSKSIKTIKHKDRPLHRTDISVPTFHGYAFVGNKIHILNDEIHEVDLYYYQTPSSLCMPSDSAKIISSSVGGGKTELIVDRVPPLFTRSSDYDLVSKEEPIFTDLQIDSFEQRSVKAMVDGEFEVHPGLYLTKAGETPFPQIPMELFSLLCEATLVKCFQAIGDFEAMGQAQSKMNELYQLGTSAISQRSEDPQVILPPRWTRGRRRWLTY